MFSISKEITFWALPSSRIVKSSGLRFATIFPLLSLTRHVHQHQFAFHAKGVIRSSAAMTEAPRSVPAASISAKVLFNRRFRSEVICSSRQKRNRAVIVICRMAPTAVTRPNVGEFTTVSIDE